MSQRTPTQTTIRIIDESLLIVDNHSKKKQLFLPLIVRDFDPFHWNVEVDSDENAFVLEFQTINTQLVPNVSPIIARAFRWNRHGDDTMEAWSTWR